MFREKKANAIPGWPMLFLTFVVAILGIAWLIASARAETAWGAVGATVLILADVLTITGLTVVNPNEARVVLLFGNYTGSVREPGLWWVNPFTIRRRVSLRVRNFESSKLKVNDHDGNPIEIAAVVVWKVVDSAEAMFQVDNYDHFVTVQTEAALRNLASSYAYDPHDEGISLRAHISEVAEQLKQEIQSRLAQAGVEVVEARISHLAYAPEIAGAMLRRQQASAIVAARTKIVAGAVGMVEMALDQLAERHVVELDAERKAAMVSNMLVVLCSDQHPQPVVNAGTLYQ